MLHRLLAGLRRLDLDAILAPIVLAVGAEWLWPGSGIFALGVALYVPVLIDSARRT
jgi:hypothetical protein